MCRFQSTFLGSRAAAGSLLQQGALSMRDATGQNLAEVLSEHGFDASPSAIAAIAMQPAAVKGSVKPVLLPNWFLASSWDLQSFRTNGASCKICKGKHEEFCRARLSLCIMMRLPTWLSGFIRIAAMSLSPFPLVHRYVEVHLEQGPVLQERGAALAPVAGIAGQSRLAISLTGTQVSLDHLKA